MCHSQYSNDLGSQLAVMLLHLHCFAIIVGNVCLTQVVMSLLLPVLGTAAIHFRRLFIYEVQSTGASSFANATGLWMPLSEYIISCCHCFLATAVNYYSQLYSFRYAYKCTFLEVYSGT